MPWIQRHPISLVVCLWASTLLLITLFETRLPSTDVFLFKEAGVNFAMKGEFVVANLPHMPHDVELPYAYYPPVYPFVFGVWSSVFGVGLKQSIVFDYLIMGLRAFLILLLLLPVLKPVFSQGKDTIKGWVALLGVLALSFMTSDGDRPDELAFVFGLLSWWFIGVKDFRWGRLLFGGVLLGLCGATSPAVGSFFCIGSRLALLGELPFLVSLFDSRITFYTDVSGLQPPRASFRS